MKAKKAPPTEGQEALTAYIKKHYDSIHAFCAAHDIDRIYLARVLHRDRGQRITVDFACAIQDATKGAVRCEQWRRTDKNRPRYRRAA